MATTSYSTIPSSTYTGLGSQGDLLHAANYGTYDTGAGALAAHPYQYQPVNIDTHLTDTRHPTLYASDFHQPTYSNTGYSSQQPSTSKYGPQSTYTQQQQQQQPLDGYSNSRTSRYNTGPPAAYNTSGSYAAAATHPTQKPTTDNPHVDSTIHHQTSHAGTTQHHPPSQTNLVRSEHQISSHATGQQQQHPQQQQQQPQQQQPPQQNPKQQNQKQQNPKQNPPPGRRRSPSTGANANGYVSENAQKTEKLPPDTKMTKSTMMRAAAIKQKEETRELKQKNPYFPSTNKKSTPTTSKTGQNPPITDGEQSDTHKPKKRDYHPHKKPHENKQPQQRKSRRDGYHSDDNKTNNSSGDDDDDRRSHHHRNKSQKRGNSDSRLGKYPLVPPILPPLRRGRQLPPYYDPFYDYPYPHPHPHGNHPRGRYPPYDDFLPYGPYPHGGDRYDRYRHLYDDAEDVPPYLAPYHDAYDPFFDYEKRRAKSKLHQHKSINAAGHEDHGAITGNETEKEDDAKSRHSKKSKKKGAGGGGGNSGENDGQKSHRDEEEHLRHHWADGYYPQEYGGRDMLELWRQERNDYLKKKFKPTIHDVLYSQQWMKSDSYLENQRRRALRDAQGYYFPYKRYTIKDYKDLQRNDTQNPYAAVNDLSIDRKERARKRHNYGTHLERTAVDVAGGEGTRYPPPPPPPRDVAPRKPWHLSHGETNDPEKGSKRNRALEYAKVQVVKHRPTKAQKNPSGASDPTEQYVNSLFPQVNDDGEGSINERTSKTNQSADDDDL